MGMFTEKDDGFSYSAPQESKAEIKLREMQKLLPEIKKELRVLNSQHPNIFTERVLTKLEAWENE